MTPEHVKVRLAIQGRKDSGDSTALATIANHLLDTIIVLTQEKTQLDNYVLHAFSEGKWIEVAIGTKEYCLGRAEEARYRCCITVRDSGFIVWPEEEWGEKHDGSSY